MKERGGMPYDVVAFEADELAHALSESEEGIFHRMLRKAWMNGSIPADMNSLADLCRVRPSTLRKAWPKLSKLWVVSEENPERLQNKKQESERIFLESKRELASAAGKLSAKAREIKRNESTDAEPTLNGRSTPHPLPSPSQPNKEENKKGKGTGTMSAEADAVLEFEQFWISSTKRGSKKEAFAEWKRIPAEVRRSGEVSIGMIAWQASYQWQDETKQPHVFRWLKREGWKEIVPKNGNGGSGNGRHESRAEYIERTNRETAALFDATCDGVGTADAEGPTRVIRRGIGGLQ